MHKNQDDQQILVFRVGPVVCSVSSRLIESIVDYQTLHHFPGQADFILGVLHYRNHAVPVVNLFNKFSLPEPDRRSDSCFMMGSTIHGAAGFWVDQVLEVTTQYDLHKSNPPRFSDTDIFDCTLLWGEHMVLQTDLNCLFAMNDPEPLQEWVSENQQKIITSTNSSNLVDDNAWHRSVSDASAQEIDLLVSRGEEFSPKTEGLVDRSVSSSETTLSGSQPSEILSLVVDEINSDMENQENAQFSLRFRSVSEINDGYHTGDQIQLRFATQFLLNTQHEDVTSVVIPSEIEGETVTLDVIAEQHGDIEHSVINIENAELPSLSNISQVPVGIEVSGTDIQEKNNVKPANIDVVESDTAFLHTDYVANDPDHLRHIHHEKIEPQNTEPSSTDITNESKLKSEFFSSFSNSTSLNHLENECETMRFGADSMLNGTSEFDVLDEHSQITNKKDHLKRDAAIEKVASRITQKNERTRKTPRLRVVASIIISAFAVFLLQQYWLNAENEKTLANVPSLQLLKERVDDKKLSALGSLQTVSDRYGEKYSLKTPQERDL